MTRGYPFIRTLLFRVGLWFPTAGVAYLALAAAQPGDIDPTFFRGPYIRGAVYSVAIQADGEVLIGGGFTEVHGVPCRWLARLHPDNSVDAAFTTKAGLVGSSNGIVSSVLVLADQKILLAGDFTEVQGVARKGIARLLPDGSLDGGFDPGGGARGIWTMRPRPDGRIVVAGGFTTYDGKPRSGVAQLQPNGTLDTSFDPGSGADNLVTSLLVQPDGKLVLAGLFADFDNVLVNGLARLLPDGRLDDTFQTGTGLDGFALALARQQSGGILVGGAFTTLNGTICLGLARLLDDGSVDTSIDPGAYFNAPVWSVVVQPDDRILVGGDFTKVGGRDRVRLARLDP